MTANDIRRRWDIYDKEEYQTWLEGIRAANPDISVETRLSIKKGMLPQDAVSQIFAIVSEHGGEMGVAVTATLPPGRQMLLLEAVSIPMFTDKDFQEAIKDVPPDGDCEHLRTVVDVETGVLLCGVCGVELPARDSGA